MQISLRIVACVAGVVAFAVGCSGVAYGVSPGGRGKLVFVAWDGNEAGNHLEHIVTAESDGSGQQVLTTSGKKSLIPVSMVGIKDVEDVSWSPDGSKILYVARTYLNGDESATRVHIMNADGSGDKEVVPSVPSPFGGMDTSPTWSPDGSTIVFDRTLDEYKSTAGWPTSRLWVMDSDGSNQRELAKVFARDPEWSPDGARIVFQLADSSASGLAVVAANGSGVEQLSNSGAQASWSPDGSKIAFSDNRQQGQFSYDAVSEIYVMNVNGGGVRQVTDNAKVNEGIKSSSDQVASMNPAWSPDGREILFMRTSLYNRDPYQFWLIRSDGSNQRPFMRDPRIFYVQGQWLSNSSGVVRGECNGSGCDRGGARFVIDRERQLVKHVEKARLSHSGFMISGRLVDKSGGGISGAVVDVLSRPRVVGGRQLRVGTVKTGANGKFRVRVSAGPSRTVSLGYHERLFDSDYKVLWNGVRQTVSGAVLLRVSKRVKRGVKVRISGKVLGGYCPHTGNVVEFQILFGKRFRVFKTVRSDRRGTYQGVVVFRRAGRYKVRARVRSSQGWPFQTTTSTPRAMTIK